MSIYYECTFTQLSCLNGIIEREKEHLLEIIEVKNARNYQVFIVCKRLRIVFENGIFKMFVSGARVVVRISKESINILSIDLNGVVCLCVVSNAQSSKH